MYMLLHMMGVYQADRLVRLYVSCCVCMCYIVQHVYFQVQNTVFPLQEMKERHPAPINMWMRKKRKLSNLSLMTLLAGVGRCSSTSAVIGGNHGWNLHMALIWSFGVRLCSRVQRLWLACTESQCVAWFDSQQPAMDSWLRAMLHKVSLAVSGHLVWIRFYLFFTHLLGWKDHKPVLVRYFLLVKHLPLASTLVWTLYVADMWLTLCVLTLFWTHF